jgi:hypothetical protein
MFIADQLEGYTNSKVLSSRENLKSTVAKSVFARYKHPNTKKLTFIRQVKYTFIEIMIVIIRILDYVSEPIKKKINST